MAVDPNTWIKYFSKNLRPEDTVVCDAGSSYYLCHQKLELPDGARLITDLAQGAMGFAIPAGIGAAMAKKHGHVYVITGDGSYLFSSHNLYTVLAQKIENLSIFVLCNDGYKTIRSSQDFWCDGRKIGLQDGIKELPWIPGSSMVITFVPCTDYEVRRPTVG